MELSRCAHLLSKFRGKATRSSNVFGWRRHFGANLSLRVDSDLTHANTCDVQNSITNISKSDQQFRRNQFRCINALRSSEFISRILSRVNWSLISPRGILALPGGSRAALLDLIFHCGVNEDDEEVTRGGGGSRYRVGS